VIDGMSEVGVAAGRGRSRLLAIGEAGGAVLGDEQHVASQYDSKSCEEAVYVSNAPSGSALR
jgi:hypothetical protein